MVALGVTTDADVVVSVGLGHVAGAADATGAVRPRRTLGARGPELRIAFLDRDGRGNLLRGGGGGGGDKDKTKQAAGKERPEQNKNSESGLKGQVKHDTAYCNTHKQHINSTVAWQTIQHSVAAECSV